MWLTGPTVEKVNCKTYRQARGKYSSRCLQGDLFFTDYSLMVKVVHVPLSAVDAEIVDPPGGGAITVA